MSPDVVSHLFRRTRCAAVVAFGGVILSGCASSSKTEPQQPSMRPAAIAEAITAEERVGLAQSNRALGMIDAAIQNLDQALAQEPDLQSALNLRASLHIDQRNYAQALLDLDRSIALAPSAWAFYERGRVHLFKNVPRRGDVETAIRDFDDALALRPDYPEAMFDRAFAYLQGHDYPRAAAEFSKVIRLGTYRLGAAYRYRSDARQRNGELLAALADISRAAELDPTDRGNLVQRSIIFRDLKRYPEAMHEIDRAIAMERDIGALVTRSTLLYHMQRYDEAIADMAEVIEKDPAAGAYSDRALYRMAKRDYAAALADIDEALKLDARHVPTLRLRYQTKALQGDHPGVVESLDAYLAIEPNSVEALLLRGQYSYNSGKVESAAADFDRAIKLAPKNPEAHWGRGIAWIRSGEPKKSLSFFAEACALDPQFAKAYSGRVEAYMALRDFNAALAAAKEGVAVAPESAESYYSLASAYYMLKDYARAVDACDEFLRRDDTWPAARQLRDQAMRKLREAAPASPPQ